MFSPLPKITIVTPSFNQGVYLEQTIQSVLDQQYPNLEYLVIDGGSTDQSVEIIRKYERHLTYWVSEKDKGQSDAINKGLQRATGEIFNWLNSDDYYEPNALRIVAAAFEQPDTRVVCGRSRKFRGQDEAIGYSSGSDVYSGSLAKTIGWARIDQPETFFHLSAIQQMGPLNARLHYLMDRDWWIKYLFLFGLKGITRVPEVLVNFRFHDNSKTVSQQPGFQIERDSYYFSLARRFGYTQLSERLKKVATIDEDFAVQSVGEPDPALVQEALHYFLLLRAEELYAQNERAKSQILLNFIQTDLLLREDKQHWQRLFFRNKYIPQLIINLLRKSPS